MPNLQDPEVVYDTIDVIAQVLHWFVIFIVDQPFLLFFVILHDALSDSIGAKLFTY